MTPNRDITTTPMVYDAEILDRVWLSAGTFELTLSRPKGFQFNPGQYIRLTGPAHARDYSLVSAPDAEHLRLCIRHIPTGKVSVRLARDPLGSPIRFSGPHGYFTFQTSPRVAVWVATGTGIAPFVSMVLGGAANAILLHGVRLAGELYYRELLERHTQCYIPCLSGDTAGSYSGSAYSGRVSQYLRNRLQADLYDFYLCGKQEMIRETTLIIDERFPDPRIYTEIFHAAD